MNNLRLLAGLLSAILPGVGVCARASERVVTLDEIFATAEASSAQLRPSLTAIGEADAAAAAARAARLPEIDASLSVSFIGDGFTTDRGFADYQPAPIPHFGNTVAVGVEQPLYTGGAITNSIKLAELKSTAARYAADMQRDNIRFRLTGFYLDLYKYSNLRRVVVENIALARKVLAEMQARYDQGTALQNDITRYELLLSNYELDLTRIDNMLEILNTNLVTTAGLPADTRVLPDTTILSRSLPECGEAQWQDRAATSAPSLRMAETGVGISRRAENLVKADRLPKVGLRAGWSLEGPILVEVPPINRNLSYWYVGLGVSYNISSLYKTGKKLRESRAATQRAADELAAAQENVQLAVRADHIRYLEAYEELRTREKGLELAERNYRTTATRYSADMALITDMLDAANSRLDAGQQLVNARINIIYYYYKLLFVTGTI